MDTSTVAKRYITETGSGWVRSITNRKAGHTIILSEIGAVEFVSVLARQKREKNISERDFHLLHSLFFIHVRTHYKIIKTDARVYHEARNLLPKYTLRTLDAVQLASAILTQRIGGTPVIFTSADTRLLSIAQTEGFTGDNPNNYP